MLHVGSVEYVICHAEAGGRHDERILYIGSVHQKKGMHQKKNRQISVGMMFVLAAIILPLFLDASLVSGTTGIYTGKDLSSTRLQSRLWTQSKQCPLHHDDGHVLNRDSILLWRGNEGEESHSNTTGMQQRMEQHLNVTTFCRGGGGGGVRQPTNMNGPNNGVIQKHVDCVWVNQVLNERVEQVLSGARGRNFAAKYKRLQDDIDGGIRPKVAQNNIAIINARTAGTQDEDLTKRTVLIKQQVSSATRVWVAMETLESKVKKTLGDTIDWLRSHHSPRHQKSDCNRGAIVVAQSCFPTDITSLELRVPQAVPTTVNVANPSHAQQEQSPSFLRLCIRALHLSWNFSPVLATLGLAWVSADFRERYWYGLVGNCLAKSGPAFIKWGQWASTRSDMFPDGLCASMANLHADAPAHSWKFTQRQVENSLHLPKGKLFEVFKSFDAKPVASGSIAQVHRAVLRPPIGMSPSSRENNDPNNGNKGEGTLVAVKVRHPNVSRLIDMDFRLMGVLADICDCIPSLSWLHVRSSVEQFSHTMAAQAHLHVEAHHLEVLNYNFRKWPDIGFPRPFFASAAVIMETFEKGRIVTDIMDMYDNMALTSSQSNGGVYRDLNNIKDKMTVEEARDGNDAMNSIETIARKGDQIWPVDLAKFIVTNGLSLYLKMLLVDNLMHADLHPGNIMLDVYQIGSSSAGSSTSAVSVGNGDVTSTSLGYSLKKGVTKQTKRHGEVEMKAHISLVDAGMVAQLNEEESVNFIGLFAALGEGDGAAAAAAILRFSPPEDKQEQVGISSSQHKKDCPPCDRGLYTGPLGTAERRAFTVDMVTLFEEKCRGYGTNVDVGGVLRGLLGVIRKHRVRIDANYATLVINALCVESMAKRVCPTYNLLDASKPLLRSYKNICHSNDGGRSICATSKLRQNVLRLCMPILYLRKRAADERFFRNLQLRLSQERNLPKSSSLIIRERIMKTIQRGVVLAAMALTAREIALCVTTTFQDDDIIE